MAPWERTRKTVFLTGAAFRGRGPAGDRGHSGERLPPLSWSIGASRPLKLKRKLRFERVQPEGPRERWAGVEVRCVGHERGFLCGALRGRCVCLVPE